MVLTLVLSAFLLLSCLPSSSAWVTSARKTAFRQSTSLPAEDTKENQALLGGLFASAEWLGRLASPGVKSNEDSYRREVSSGPRSVAAVAELIRAEYDKIFWATGDMDLSLWQDNCTFSDPFSSFGGPGSSARFKRNADNLGRFVLDPRLKITSFKVEEYSVSVGWMFSGVLRLPWRPVLAASGESSHVLNPESLLIERYEERWKSDPLEVVKRLFLPGKQR